MDATWSAGTQGTGDGQTPLTRGYEAGNIAAVYYDAQALPSEATLVADLQRFVALYRALVEAKDQSDAIDDPDGDDDGPADSETAIEARRLRWHYRVDRNRDLSKKAKKIHGTTCMICGFDYKSRYGQIGDGYIEAHHLTPVGDLEGRPTELDARKDFAVLCANCHRMVHQRRPPWELADIRSRLRG